MPRPGVLFWTERPQMTLMNITETAVDIKNEFDFLDDWETRYAHIIDLGKSNKALAPHERTEETRVRGCTSQVWLVSDAAPEGHINIRAESDAMIVSGLVAILIRLFSGQKADEILSFDATNFFNEIGVMGALTAQRSNGLASMLERIRTIASEVASDTL